MDGPNKHVLAHLLEALEFAGLLHVLRLQLLEHSRLGRRAAVSLLGALQTGCLNTIATSARTVTGFWGGWFSNMGSHSTKVRRACE
jgi:hypothetical protein